MIDSTNYSKNKGYCSKQASMSQQHSKTKSKDCALSSNNHT